MKTSEQNAADESAILLPPRSSTNSTVAVRNETITRVASEPTAWIGSALARRNPRLSASSGRRRSSSAAGTARPTDPSQTTAGRMTTLYRNGTGRKIRYPTRNAVAIADAGGLPPEAISTPPT